MTRTLQTRPPRRRPTVLFSIAVALTVAVSSAAPAVAAEGTGATSAGSASTSAGWAQGLVDEQVAYILSRQVASGAILTTDSSINPYFANQAAIGLVAANTVESRGAALRWMQWFLDHRNTDDPTGVKGTVYDYIYNRATGAESSKGTYDSIDSYLATALTLAHDAYATGDPQLRAFVDARIVDYEQLANVLVYAPPRGVRSETSRLTTAKATFSAEYLLDNAEVAQGLAKLSALDAMVGRSASSQYYGTWAGTTRTAIKTHLWDASSGTWKLARGNTSSLTSWYAGGGRAQYAPTLFGVVAPTSAEATASWDALTAAFPTWATDADVALPNLGAVAAAMGEETAARAYLQSLRDRFEPRGWLYPTTCDAGPGACSYWYPGVGGQFIQAVLAVGTE